MNTWFFFVYQLIDPFKWTKRFCTLVKWNQIELVITHNGNPTQVIAIDEPILIVLIWQITLISIFKSKQSSSLDSSYIFACIMNSKNNKKVNNKMCSTPVAIVSGTILRSIDRTPVIIDQVISIKQTIEQQAAVFWKPWKFYIKKIFLKN